MFNTNLVQEESHTFWTFYFMSQTHSDGPSLSCGQHTTRVQQRVQLYAVRHVYEHWFNHPNIDVRNNKRDKSNKTSRKSNIQDMRNGLPKPQFVGILQHNSICFLKNWLFSRWAVNSTPAWSSARYFEWTPLPSSSFLLSQMLCEGMAGPCLDCRHSRKSHE